MPFIATRMFVYVSQPCCDVAPMIGGQCTFVPIDSEARKSLLLAAIKKIASLVHDEVSMHECRDQPW